MSIKIVTDSACGVDIHNKNGIMVVPLEISINGKNYLDQFEITNDEFYSFLVKSKTFPKTSQPAPIAFTDIFYEAKKNNDDVIVIVISSALSGTYQNALLAKNIVDYNRIYIIDSLSTIQGQVILVNEAKRLADEKHSALEIVTIINNLKTKIDVLAVIDTLEYLHKGGRVSKTTAILGNIIGIKPLITISRNGTVEVYGKAIGITRAVNTILNSINPEKIDFNYPVYFVYTNCMEQALSLQEKTKQKYDLKETKIGQLGGVIGSHIGPNGFGIVYIKK